MQAVRALVSARGWVLPRTVRLRTALSMVVIVYVVGWAYGLTLAVQVRTGSFHPPAVTTAAQGLDGAAEFTSVAVAVVTLAVVLARCVGVRAGDLGLGRRDRRDGLLPESPAAAALGEVGSAAVFVLAYLAAVGVADALRAPGYPFPPGRWTALPYLVRAAWAGPTEEIGLVAFPTVLLRRAGVPWPVVGLLAVGLRVSFHLYYGWGTLGIAVWAVLV